MDPLTIVASAGLLLSLYAFYVEGKASKGPAVCDISSKVRCSKVLSSPYSKTFGVKNPVWGVVFYIFVLVLVHAQQALYVRYLAWLAVAGSLYLAWVMHTKVKYYCLVCGAIYLANILLLYFSYS
ncbi:MAG: vitamin K epoxide reductase family protein [Candidatus Woesearchaeota archaeon]|jgi:uncharacterized membrane protein|nr:vitamin K epoxide reductase family protein [Candidatus Woesearchaeota archaeon]MDP7180977.1 vitamin K epoxide reductase family protein [Candidatus Woesearchaeota archaeon]MDP7198402.1 vitamin K epoxide reductase family protein [Candidatus Woesearchaeota archaeon]MDP7467503.1 vitamin K epoxide reductase family protein [Candidatus Woesearchaeota archaeon]MDP7647731.1 vitamin K epoxide reductase family protein [Candidatus Woesearchaeota archaeon]